MRSMVVAAILGNGVQLCLAANVPSQSSELVDLINSKGILKSPVSASIQGSTVVVAAYVDLSTSDNEVRFKAASIGKAIHEKFSGVESIRTVFYDRKGAADYRVVEINKTIAGMFAKGDITQAELPRILKVEKVAEATKAKSRRHNATAKANSAPAPVDAPNHPPAAPPEQHIDLGSLHEPPEKRQVSRWSLGYFPLLTADIVKDPDTYLAQCKMKFEALAKTQASADKRFANGVEWFALVLHANNYIEDARRFESEARRIRANCR